MEPLLLLFVFTPYEPYSQDAHSSWTWGSVLVCMGPGTVVSEMIGPDLVKLSFEWVSPPGTHAQVSPCPKYGRAAPGTVKCGEDTHRGMLGFLGRPVVVEGGGR